MSADDFKKYLEEQTILQPGSIIKYVNEVKKFKLKVSKPNTESLNKYVILQSKKYHNNRSKYALKHYLAFVGHPEDYKAISKVKKQPRQKIPIWHELKIVKGLIRKLPSGKYKDMAILQIAVGARAREVLTIKEENIDLNQMKVMIIGKGNKTGYFFYPQQFRIILEKYMKGKKGYLFLPEHANTMDSYTLERHLATQTMKYNRYLAKAAAEQGIPRFSSHDFRRCFSNGFQLKSGNVHQLMTALRHSDIKTTLAYIPEYTEDVRHVIDEYQKELI